MRKPLLTDILQGKENATPNHEGPGDETPPVPPDTVPPAPIKDPPAPGEKAPIDEGPKGPKMIV